jgi:antitoxin ParD1/3/4
MLNGVASKKLLKSWSASIMQTTQKLSVPLPNDMAEVVKPALASGEYALANEVIRDGRVALDTDLENWLVHQVGPAYDALITDPTRALTAAQVRAKLVAEHQLATNEA